MVLVGVGKGTFVRRRPFKSRPYLTLQMIRIGRVDIDQQNASVGPWAALPVMGLIKNPQSISPSVFRPY
jgi:hypothetical protein